MSLELLIRRPGGSPLVRDYVAGDESALRFFPRSWNDPAAFLERARDVRSRFDRASLERAAGALRTPSDGAARTLERVVEEGGFMVTTGQQPGLFGGPLYSVYKALTAVRLAATLEEVLDAPVLPVFWVASDDHDWDEAHDTWLVDTDNRLRHLELPRPSEEEGLEEPLHRMMLDGEVERCLGELLEALPDTDFTPPLQEILRSAWRPGVAFSHAFRDTLEGLLGPLGMAFTEAHDPVLKEASVPVLRRSLELSERVETELHERSRSLDEAGYHVQVHVMEGGVNLFVEGPGGRERLHRDGDDRFHLRHSRTSFSREELETMLREEPGRMSPNVLLRPVVEGTVFPTVAYVAGPGETAYYAQLAPLYEAHDVGMPVIYPRFSVTAVESKVGKVLEKFGLEVEDLHRPFHEVAGEIARDEVPPDVKRILGELRGAVGQKTAELQDATRDVDPTLKGPVSHARSVAFDALGDLEAKIVQAVKRENDIALQQLEKASVHLFPEGKPQERVINPFYYLARYGDRFLHDVAERFDTSLPALPSTSAGA